MRLFDSFPARGGAAAIPCLRGNPPSSTGIAWQVSTTRDNAIRLPLNRSLPDRSKPCLECFVLGIKVDRFAEVFGAKFLLVEFC